ncbi:MAG: trypsin-like peptidase domain-containing protein [Acidobacteria bacterium]|nr:trypsin-like peptidase domain-containing protein [Acidobacteriota bacterium]
MRSRSIYALVWLAAGALASASQAQLSVYSGLVKISAPTFDGKAREGTGFVVATERRTAYILTAAHVVEGSPRIEVSFYTAPNDPSEATTVGLENATDLAVLRAWIVPPGVGALRLAAAGSAQPGDAIQILGYPLNARDPEVASGFFSRREGSHLLIDARVREGSSGSPALRNSQVSGLVIQDQGRAEAFAVPVSILRAALDGWRVPFRDPPQISTAERYAQPATSGAQGCVGLVAYGEGMMPLRPIPSNQASTSSLVGEGSEVTVLQQKGAEGKLWYLVSTSVGSGWIPAEFVHLSQQCSPS